jgi:hypothetical protein
MIIIRNTSSLKEVTPNAIRVKIADFAAIVRGKILRCGMEYTTKCGISISSFQNAVPLFFTLNGGFHIYSQKQAIDITIPVGSITSINRVVAEGLTPNYTLFSFIMRDATELKIILDISL